MAGYAEIFVVARDAVKSRALCKSIADALSDVVPSRVQLHGCDFSRLPLMAPHLVVNCTPLGLKNEEVPSDIAALIKRIGPHGLFMDTVYSRGKSTKLCQVAAEAGIASGDGKSMLVEQALLAFEYWTGRKPPSELLWTAIDNATQ